ncbi:GPI transamidase component GAA1 [Plectosphaerella plurivora]|uniref:GPI transamidase component GAA1 n=1 Tax=Plectosphaerella plurivora TaxID=936078 RepID=A0A9P9A642_9PEZI|nr:GPI transamidase component GAA1 [Plectosphaerella plurivora]
MSRLISTALSLRRDPRVLKLPPYLSLLCIIAGVAWLFMLPLNDYSRRTYISENALLPGQVHAYFSGSDQHVFRGYRHETNALENKTNIEINDYLGDILGSFGLKVGRQNYTYESSGTEYSGENVYAILQAPRGDATEAIVLVTPWRNVKGDFNRMGIPLLLTLARYFKRWSLWSKDIIFVIPPDARTGTQAWVDAYHDSHDPTRVNSLPLKSGALQGAIALDYAQESRFKHLHISYDGVNGQLPNLDLINAVANIAQGQMGIPVGFQEMWDVKGSDKYEARLQTMLRGMLKQGLGYASGPHSSFIPYHVDAVTLHPFGDGWQDEMAMGRVIEGSFRSLNNLLEHLHQSFFFYLLMNKERFVSIGTYLPSAMILAANFSIMAIFYWVKSGYKEQDPMAAAEKTSEKSDVRKPATLPPATAERALTLPLGIVVFCHFIGALPLLVFNNLPESLLAPLFGAFAMFNAALPLVLSTVITTAWHPTIQQYHLVKSFSLLLLGMFLSALATLNFSLSLLVGVFAAPLSFMQPSSNPAIRYASLALLQLVSPPAVLYSASSYFGLDVGLVLKEAAFGWDVWGMYTPVVMCCVWWPAWLAGSLLVLGQPSL